MKKEERFEIVCKEGSSFGSLKQVLVDRETGVNYLYIQSGSAGGLTVLLDRDGKPVVSTVTNSHYDD